MGAKAQTSRRKSKTLRNLRQRPAKPALRNGRIQKGCLRALWAFETASTAQALEFAYALKLHRGELRHCDYYSVRRALASIGAVPIGRSRRGSGRAMLWKMREEISAT